MIRLAVVGSRTITDFNIVADYLDDLIFKTNKISAVGLIISGGARGIDRLAERYADERGIKKKVIKPDWNTYGKRAGYLRNIEIVKNASMVVAIWDGKSKGTKHTIDIAEREGKEVIIFKYVGGSNGSS